MAKCEICKCSPIEKTLFRINETGVAGIWRCKEHLNDHVVDPEIARITGIIDRSIPVQTELL